MRLDQKLEPAPCPRRHHRARTSTTLARFLQLALLLLTPSVLIAQGTVNANLLSDNGFESGELRPPFSVLGMVGAEIDSSVSLAGRYSLKTTRRPFINLQTFDSQRAVAPLRGGETLQLSGWMLGDAAAVPAAAEIHCLDRSYRPLDLASATLELTATSQWQPFELSHTCPAKSRYVGLGLRVHSQGSSVWWDQLALRPQRTVAGQSLGWDFEHAELPAQLSSATGATLALDDQQAMTGQQSLRITANSNDGYTGPWRLSEQAAIARVEADETFVLSAWAMADELDVPIQLRIFCLDESFQHLDGGTPLSDQATVLWRPFSVARTCPAGSRYASVRLDVDAADRTVWWDALRFETFEPGQLPSAELLADPGFEGGSLPAGFRYANFGALSLDDTVSHTGGSSLRHQANASNSNTVPWWNERQAAVWAIENDRPLVITAWAKADLDLTDVELLLVCLDDQYQRGTLPLARGSLLAGTDWQSVSAEVACPTEASFVSVRLMVKTGGRTVWWDDLSLKHKALELPFQVRELGRTIAQLRPGQVLDFGSTEAGRAIQRELEILNTGGASVSLTPFPVTVEGEEFELASSSSALLAPGDSLRFTVSANGSGPLGDAVRSLRIQPAGQTDAFDLRLKRTIPRHPDMALLFQGEEIEFGQIVDLGEAPAGSLRDDLFQIQNRSGGDLSFADGDIRSETGDFSIVAEQPFEVADAESTTFTLRSYALHDAGAHTVGQMMLGAAGSLLGDLEIRPFLRTVEWMFEPLGGTVLAGRICKEAVSDGVHWAHPEFKDPNSGRKVLLIEQPGYHVTTSSSQARISVTGRGRFNAPLPSCPGGQGSPGCEPLQLQVGCFWNDSINSPGDALFDKSDPDHFVPGGSGGTVYGPQQAWPCALTPPTELVPRCDENGQPVKYLGWVVVAFRSITSGFWTPFGVIGSNPDVCVQRTLHVQETVCDDQTRLVGRIEGLSAAAKANIFVTQTEPSSAEGLRDIFEVSAREGFTFDVQSEVSSGWNWEVEVRSLGWLAPGQTAGPPPFNCPNVDFNPSTMLGIENRTGTGGGQPEVEVVIHCECTLEPESSGDQFRGGAPPNGCEDEPTAPDEYHVWFDVDYSPNSEGGSFTAELNGGAQQVTNIGGPGIFRFPSPLPDGSEFEVSVVNVDPTVECHVGDATQWAVTESATGRIDGRDSFEISIHCFDPILAPCEQLPQICDEISECEYESFILEPEAPITTITGEPGSGNRLGSTNIFRSFARCPDPYDLSGDSIISYGAGLYLRNEPGLATTSSAYTIQGVARDDILGVEEVGIYIGDRPAQHGGTLAINQYDPWTCIEQPSTACNNFSAFSAQIDATQLSPGVHDLTVVAYNTDRVPTILQSTLTVGSHGGSGTTPSPPLSVSALGGEGRIDVSWSASSGASEYLIYRDDDPTPGNSTLIAGPFGPSSRNYTDTTVTAGQNYCYWVKARNIYGTSGYGPTSTQSVNCAVADSSSGGGGGPGPNPPTNVSASNDRNDRIVVSWSASAGAEEYLLHRGVGPSVDQASLLLVPLGPFNLSYDDTDPSLVAGQTYCYWVKARNSDGTSDFGPTQNLGSQCGQVAVSVGTPPAPPATVSASSHLTDRIRVDWSASAGADRYLLYRDSDGSPIGSELILTTTGSSILSYDDPDSGLVPGQFYCYRVRAENGNGLSDLAPTGSTTSHCGQVAEEGGGGSAPPPPATVTASSDQSDRITVSWSAASGAERYLLYRDDDQTSAGATLIRTNHGYNNRTFHDADPNLLPGTTYCYWVKAQNNDGTSPYGPTTNPATRCGQRLPTAGPELTLRRPGGFAVAYDGNLHFNTMEGRDQDAELVIENQGNAALNLSGLSLPGAYYSSTGLPTSIAAGQSATFTVTLSGSSPGTFNGVMTFQHNAIDQPRPFRVQLNGEVVPLIQLP